MTNENSKINAKGGDNLSLPIGIRQRNHLNIRVNDKNHWVGEQFRSVNHKFCTFEDELFGYVDDFFMPEPCMAFKDFYVSLIHYMAMVEIGAENEKYIDDKKISQAFDMLFPGL